MIYIWDNGGDGGDGHCCCHEIHFIVTDLLPGDVDVILAGEPGDDYTAELARGRVLGVAIEIAWRAREEDETTTLDTWVRLNFTRPRLIGKAEPHERVKRAIDLCKKYGLGGWA